MDESSIDLDWPHAARLSFFIVFTYAVANILILVAIIKKRVHKDDDFTTFTLVDFFIITISVSDTLAGMGYSAVYIWTRGNLANSQGACDFLSFTESLFSGTSLMSLFLLALSRYAVVRDPLHGGLRWRTAIVLSASVWLTGILFGVFVLATGITEQSPSRLYCFGGYQSTNASTLINALATLSMILGPSAGIFYFYVAIVRHVKDTVKEHPLLKKLANMCFTLNIIYIFALFPFSTEIIHVLATGRKYPESWDAVCFICATMNFFSNPFVYIAYQRRYRKALFDLIGINKLRQHYGYPPFGQSLVGKTKPLKTNCSLTTTKGSSALTDTLDKDDAAHSDSSHDVSENIHTGSEV